MPGAMAAQRIEVLMSEEFQLGAKTALETGHTAIV